MSCMNPLSSRPSRLVLIAGVALGCLSQAASADYIARAWGSVGPTGPAFWINPSIGATLWMLSDSDRTIPIPINRNVTGQVSAFSRANFTTDAAPGVGEGNITGVILRPAAPAPILSSVETRQTLANSFGASASAKAAIAGQYVAGPRPGDIMGAVAKTTTSGNAVATLGIAAAAVVAGTDPFIVDPQPVATRFRLDVDLAVEYATNPNALQGAFASVEGSGPGGGFASNSKTYNGITNIPGLGNLFTLGFSADTGTPDIHLNWNSDDPMINAMSPILSSDFSPSPNGGFILSPDKYNFSVYFTAPAGVIDIKDGESRGLAVDILDSESAYAEASVPTPGALALAGVGGLLAARRRRRA